MDTTKQVKNFAYLIRCKSKEEHLKRLYELSLKTIGEIPQLEEPNHEQKRWIKSWRVHK